MADPTLAEIIANPAGYTPKGTALLAAVDGLEILAGTLNGLVGTTNTALTTLSGLVDQLEGYTDTLETLIGSTNTKLDTLNTSVSSTAPVTVTFKGEYE